jgi:hypothetical protein
LLAEGDDLETTEAKPGGRNALLDAAMRVEAAAIARVPLPFGVSIHCVARKV